ncbi:PREDICTED: protein FANTASTIC FOUR 1-like [Camelina sativa]|uniref:Protein FANTASTIC FOUR 1-like n=1 Tax=Camelina sativa TaxID=90675 RepID=A0ABM0WFJ2_CAMSA|nr:PREDICTED: protein FANTASTIC FOUR 1-like [Camelina sativa]
MSFYKRSFHSFLDQTSTTKMSFESGLAHDEVNGLMLCTEYLGFESYDMRMSENEVDNKMTCHAEVETKMVDTKRLKTKENVVAREKKREFPPPLSSLNGLGQPSFYLRPVRKDGRLELTRVMIDRPEIFHASREDGRLRLQLVDGAYCGPEEIVELEDEPKGLDNEHESEEISRSDIECGREINGEDNDTTSDQVVDLYTMINDDSATKSWRCKSSHEVSVNSDNDVAHFHDDHATREWRYKIVASMNHNENNRHHHIHPYHHHNSNNNMHLWTRAYVKTR